MKNTTPKILLAVWCFWLVCRLIRIIVLPGSVALALAGLVIPVLCFWLGWRLYKKPSRSLTVWFSASCFLVFFKFCIGNIIYYQATFHSFREAFLYWLQNGFSGVLPFMDSIGATILVAFTFYYWPLFCFKRRDLQNDKPVA